MRRSLSAGKSWQNDEGRFLRLGATAMQRLACVPHFGDATQIPDIGGFASSHAPEFVMT